MQQSRDALQQFFGYSNFLDNQEQVVDNILSGEDWCVIMPTGAGKSICYQLPILMRDGYGIIVSPLISLMKDQVDALNAKKIAAGYINSTVGFAEQCQTFDAVRSGQLKLLYIAPERLNLDSFRRLLGECPPEIIIIDEAHCISQWGHDFRPSYLNIGPTIEAFGIPQVCAFTATATPQVREDICTQLRRPEMHVAVAGFKRPNLAFQVIDCATAEAKKRALAKLLQNPAPTIIYVSTRKLVDELSEEFDCIGYHAGLSDDERNEAQERFMRDPCPVLVATNAFGMGIDRPDVRRVIHYTITGTLEAYYQEAGRAGRDGEAAQCILLFSYADRFVQEFLIDMSNPTEEVVRACWGVLRRMGAMAESNFLEVTLAALAERVVEARNDTQIGSAMRILEHAGYISRSGRGGGVGQLKFNAEFDALRPTLGTRVTQRSIFLDRCMEHYGARLFSGLACSYEGLAEITQLSIEQIRRVLRALEDTFLTWTPPFSGTVTEILRPEAPELEIDFTELQNKRDFELDRLNEVVQYTRTRDCRQRYLVRYFGEDSQAWHCGNCDCCQEISEWRDALDYEREIIRDVLEAVASFHGYIGRGKLSLLLAGAKRSEIVNSRLIDSRYFGKLHNLKPNDITTLVRALESQKLLEINQTNDYSCIDISREGRAWLRTPGAVQLNQPPLPRRTRNSLPSTPPEFHEEAPTRRTKEPKTELNIDNHDLFETLRKLRREMAEERRVPPYAIFPDATLAEMANQTPATTAEAMQIKGVGPAKAATILPVFLAAIREWRSNLISG